MPTTATTAGDSAVPLLLLPGLMNDGRVWQAATAALAVTRRIVVADTHTHDSVQAAAHAALALLPDGPVAVAGFSLGGYVALEAWRQAPGRIAGLALLDTAAAADGEAARESRLRMVQAIGAGTAGFDALAAAFLPRIVHASRTGNTALAALLADMARTVGAEGFVRQQRAALGRPDSRGTLATITCPALVLCGRDDQVAPLAASEELAAGIAGAELVVVPDCGHMAPLEQPGAVVDALARWCVRVDAAKAARPSA